ncbi:hypothetical protein PQ472_05630 [Lacticaseibacillus pabuli]|uniref:YoqO-like protein n=1 Tax=Lacticaseibacillus pabuli TaxID=3025672 RepID=A0ABY7WU76_9LACO|nr:hypothetical protein [Lacticaseibacillus sp. KACC 23028]WDF83717.1 hypothetical protein PQ472_05630 [Lacticaseibacillus sp. KACC 23028]
MQIVNFIRKHFLSAIATIAFLWWFFGPDAMHSIAFYTFAVVYGAYYVQRTFTQPALSYRIARSQLIFDLFLLAIVLITIFDGSTDKLTIFGVVIFIIAIGGADLWQFIRIRRDSKKSSK